MIKKLEKRIGTIKAGDMTYDTMKPASTNEMHEKINELIDAVNGILDYAPLEMAMKAEPKTPTDPYEEQRKWIGCLCRFWDFKDGAIDIGILKAVDNLKPTIPYVNDIDCSYAFCEPVKPDDDIIYKGGDNE